MLIQLRGRVHQVYTAITLLDAASGRIYSEVAMTDVCMRSYTDAEMETYIASGDPFDKAGGYAIQNPEFHPVEELRGCYSNVVGLPLCYLAQALRDFGVTLNLKIEFECQFHPGSDCVLNAAII
jgi:predicted house-cleaning NTP pyrophosphatase (Maf/HAM1 superfamily)